MTSHVSIQFLTNSYRSLCTMITKSLSPPSAWKCEKIKDQCMGRSSMTSHLSWTFFTTLLVTKACVLRSQNVWPLPQQESSRNKKINARIVYKWRHTYYPYCFYHTFSYQALCTVITKRLAYFKMRRLVGLVGKEKYQKDMVKLGKEKLFKKMMKL